MANPVIVSTVLLLTLAAPVAAQTESDLKNFFEGRTVTLRMDMPGTKDGVNVYPDMRRSIDLNQYRGDLRQFGPALRAGDTAMITLVKVKDDLIEFQLGGGGFGTFLDNTDTSANIPLIGKSPREKFLEARVRDEDNRSERRQLQRELDGLRAYRERENRRIWAERERLSEMKRERVAFSRMNGGSRFNLRYERRVPYGIGPEDVMAALAEFVDFKGVRALFHRN